MVCLIKKEMKYHESLTIDTLIERGIFSSIDEDVNKISPKAFVQLQTIICNPKKYDKK